MGWDNGLDQLPTELAVGIPTDEWTLWVYRVYESSGVLDLFGAAGMVVCWRAHGPISKEKRPTSPNRYLMETTSKWQIEKSD